MGRTFTMLSFQSVRSAVQKMLQHPLIFLGRCAMSFLMLFVAALVFVPTQVLASGAATVPEPFSLALLATGIAGLGAAEFVRRRRNK
jgi:hypothetical protein